MLAKRATWAIVVHAIYPFVRESHSAQGHILIATDHVKVIIRVVRRLNNALKRFCECCCHVAGTGFEPVTSGV